METKLTVKVDFEINVSWKSILKAKLLGKKSVDRLVNAMSDKIKYGDSNKEDDKERI